MALQRGIQVLSENKMAEIHEKALKLLWERGIVFESDDAIAIFKSHGAKVEDHTVFFPKDMVEQALSQCPSKFELKALNPERNVIVGDGLLIHPAGGEVFVNDSGVRRNPALQDFADLQKIYQACSEVDIAGYQPLSPGDVDERVKGLYCTLVSMRHADKPLLSPMELDTIAQKEEDLHLYEIAFGGADYLESNYVTWHAVCPNSPFFYSNFACDGIMVYAGHNQPVLVVSAPMTGITSPIYLYSTVIMTVAEILAGLVLAQLVKPGVPVIPSASLTYGNMRYATWECASPDTALLLGASVQMFKDFYHLPSRAQTGVTSSKAIDYQAGLETMQSFLFTALCGVDLCSQSVGSLENLMTTSLVKTVLDNEIVARVRYMLKGMETQGEYDGMDILLQAVPCQDFLTDEATIAHFRDGWQPSISDWRTYDAWSQSGSPDIIDTAQKQVDLILSEAPDSLLESEQEKALLDYIKFVEKNL